MDDIRWAVVGTGYIANNFARGLEVVKDGVLAAVVSRGADTGGAFAERYGGKAVYTDYDRMLAEVKPDAVYLGVPNDLHFGLIMKALDAGVNVLSEKPMTDTVKQAKAVYAKAAEKGLFVMEGMWTRCFPAVRRVREWISAGAIGAPMTVNVCFNIKPDFDNWQPWKAGLAHAGGALRDVGIYSLAVADMVFPEAPVKVASTFHSNGEVDDACHLLMDYGDGRTAFAGGAFNQNSDHVARIYGSEGSIEFGPEFWHPSEAVLRRNDGTVERLEAPYAATGFQYEIMAAQDCMRRGLTECPHFTWAESLRIAELIESARREWGIVYEADKEGCL